MKEQLNIHYKKDEATKHSCLVFLPYVEGHRGTDVLHIEKMKNRKAL